MSRLTCTRIRKRLAQAPELPWSARHSQQGCRGVRGTGAAPLAPSSAAPTSVSTVVALITHAPPLSGAPARATAVLTTFEGQAVFRLLDSDLPGLPKGDLFRLRKGSLVHAPRVAVS